MGRAMRRILPRHDLDAKANHKPWEGEEPHQYDPTPIVPWAPIRTQQQIADRLGVSRGLVFKDERSAMAKLREALADLVDNPGAGR